MKKIFVSVVAAILLSFDANATNVKFDEMLTNDVNYELSLNLKQFKKDNNLSRFQNYLIKPYVYDLVDGIKNLKDSTIQNKQQKLDTLLKTNLFLVKKHLQPEQYRAFCGELQNEFNRTGLTKVMLGLK